MANPILTREFGESVGAEPTLPDLPSTGVMTKASVTLATLSLLALVVIGAVFGWQNADSVMRWWWAILIGLIALVVTAIFVPGLRPVSSVLYSLGSGAMLGAFSKEFEDLYDGIVFLALTATLVVFVVALLLYVTGAVKVTQRFRATVLVAAVGITLFYLVTLMLSFFGVDVPLVTGAGPGAVLFSILIIIVVSLGLLIDFDTIDRGIANGAPRGFSWFAAFGLITSIVWVYVEILRLLAILAARSR
jgi:uncharacterized YccA/Bax inhibitor family protein